MGDGKKIKIKNARWGLGVGVVYVLIEILEFRIDIEFLAAIGMLRKNKNPDLKAETNNIKTLVRFRLKTEFMKRLEKGAQICPILCYRKIGYE